MAIVQRVMAWADSSATRRGRVLMRRGNAVDPRAGQATGAAILALVLLAGSLHGQTDADEPGCTQGAISGIDIDNRDIFDLDQIGDRPFSWVFKLANTLHVRTRRSFIRRELLFRDGECLEPFLLEESERILRRYRFISQATVTSIAQTDGSHRVAVQTQDEWTTQMDLGVSFDEGLKLETLELTEENFLGRAMELEFFLQERREMRDYGVRFRSNRVLGSRWDSRLTLGRTRVGDFYGGGLSYPFVAEVGRYGASVLFDRRDDLFSYALPEAVAYADPEFSNVVVPFTVERVHLATAVRKGEPGNLSMLGLGITRESLRYSGFPASVGLVRRGAFDEPEPAGDEIAALVDPQVQNGWKMRVNLLLGWRKVRFERRRGLDALRGVQDVLVGSDLGLTLGANPGRLGSGGADDSDDIYARVRHVAGFEAGPFVFGSQVEVEGRNVVSGGDAVGNGWRDVLAEGDALLYMQPGGPDGHTFVARVAGAGGNNVTFPFQLTLGGREGVRGFPTNQFPGGARMIASLEARRAFNWPVPDVFDFGYTVFVDAGRTWKGDAPFGIDSGWQAAVGAGIRLGLPEGTSGVARLDLAVPVTGGRGLSDLVFRVSMREFVGLLGGVEDEQMERSRIKGIGPTVFEASR